MEGNLERAFMNATEKMDARAKAEADRRVGMEDRNQFFSAGLSVAKGAAAGAIGGAVLGAGVGAVPGAIIGGVGGLMSGASDLYSYYFAGGKQRFAQQQRLQSE